MNRTDDRIATYAACSAPFGVGEIQLSAYCCETGKPMRENR
jgi:hypothetical protein